eukprot:TRINITY_DN815_c2_g1_i1.p1 TRINITY_DN815_c2_g1~~TRINITY_DN815_c2_g1_i1.p1  ORF type:complete len:337 (+),score=84.02 TRINITY_DN815_c2_g1_i1:31-1011(+)
MQVLEAGVCQLSNFEVYHALEKWRKVRGAEQILPSEAVFKLETSLLRNTFKSEKGLGKGQVEGFLAKVDEVCSKYASPNGEPAHLTLAEKIQLLNSKPEDRVALELIVEGMLTDERIEESLTDSYISDLLVLVKHFLLMPEYKEKEKDLIYITSDEEDGMAQNEPKKKRYFDPSSQPALQADALTVIKQQSPRVKEVDEAFDNLMEMEVDVEEAPQQEVKPEPMSEDSNEKSRSKKSKSSKKPKKVSKNDDTASSSSSSSSDKKKKKRKAKTPKPTKKASRKKKAATPSDDSSSTSSASSGAKAKSKRKSKASKEKEKKKSTKKKK